MIEVIICWLVLNCFFVLFVIIIIVGGGLVIMKNMLVDVILDLFDV